MSTASTKSSDETGLCSTGRSPSVIASEKPVISTTGRSGQRSRSMAANLLPIHARHADIGKHQVERASLHLRERVRTVTRFCDLETGRAQSERGDASQSHKHAISRTLETYPGMGPIRVAQVIATVMSPHRFRSARQLWSYSGLGIAMRSSADWVMTPSGFQRVRTNKTRGLNRDYNRRLKNVFKGAATTVITQRMRPLHADYQRMTEQGTKPPMAKLTLARRIAATTLTMWKNQEVYDPDKHRNKG